MAEDPEAVLQLPSSAAAGGGESLSELSPETATPEPPSSAAVSPGTEEPPGDTKKKIDILLKAVGDTPIMKTKKWAVERTRTIQGLIDFIKKFLKLVASEQLFIYVNQSFAPSPDQEVGTLYEAPPRIHSHFRSFEPRLLQGLIRILNSSLKSGVSAVQPAAGVLCSGPGGTRRSPAGMERTELLKPRTLADLIRILHELFAGDEVNVEEVQAVLEAYESNPAEWALYAKFDQYRYTRNLVDQGNGKFNLMILCWGEGHGSSIHDHTDSHCFLKMLQGNLKETLFAWPDKRSNEMIKKSERTLRENQCAYINDSIGLHRVENVSHTEPAVSLHLYSPPFDTCHAFDQRTGHKNKVTMTFHSKFGIRTPFDLMDTRYQDQHLLSDCSLSGCLATRTTFGSQKEFEKIID
ncbi:hypothetical protein STEG23_028885 [Scotinomys teguina]